MAWLSGRDGLVPAAAGTRPADGTPEVPRSWQTACQLGARPRLHFKPNTRRGCKPATRMAMSKSLGEPESFVGVDVSEARLDVCVLPGGARASFARTIQRVPVLAIS